MEDEYASLHETGALVDESLLSWIILFGSMRIRGGAFAFDGADGCCWCATNLVQAAILRSPIDLIDFCRCNTAFCRSWAFTLVLDPIMPEFDLS